MDLKSALSMMDRVDALLVAAGEDLGVREVAPLDGYVLWLFSRVRSTFLASKILVSNRLIDEAMQLDRSLMTDALRLMKLDRVGVERHAYVLRWIHDSITERENLFRSAERAGLEGDAEAALSVLGEERRKIDRYRMRHHVARMPRIPSEKQLAIEFGLEAEYWDFEYANKVVHGSPAIAGHRLQSREDVKLVNTFTNDDTWVVASAMLANQWALFAVKAFRSMFLPQMPGAGVDEAIAEIEAAAKQAPRTSDGAAHALGS